MLSHVFVFLTQLYEIDKIRMVYQMMRSYELVYGPDASSYQNVLGVQTTTAPPLTTTLATTTSAPTPDPLEKAEKIYLCHPKDPLCKPKIVYLPTGAVPVLCDPRYNPACRPKSEEEIKAAAPPQAPAAPKESDDPPPVVVTLKGMAYDCDPFWDPDCLIDRPPRPILEKPALESPAEEKPAEEKADKVDKSISGAEATQQTLYPYFDPYDFKRDLYDPFLYANSAPAE